MRKKWEVALRREGFTASESSVICSEHFKQDEFDRTGQIVRLRDGVIPSIFSFPVHLQRPEKGRTTSTSRKAEESLSVAPQDDPEASTSHSQPQPNDANSPIATTTGQIKWRFINHLNEVQKKDGLHAANQITDKHVYFENHKRRVSLAAQTLSRSVSVALRTMRDLRYSQFKD
ncbi:THAP domain-containing protein 5-like [Gymnodraco acuticeps]|uniref:THAP domain-containing protein 5-like n=1 Tax=Gymnodraco acuticeps TaxID=8218 RepID=A0A6P8TKH9_GYMAC|nr:THAP domain-containing protein 5-like [Gymnodraco acuticeps]